MSLRLSLPKFRKAKDPTDLTAEPDLAETSPLTGFDKSRRPIRVAAIVLVALAAGQIVQSTNQSGARAATPASVKAQVVAKPAVAVLTPVVQKVTPAPIVKPSVPQAPVVPVSTKPETTAPAQPEPAVAAAPVCHDSLDLAVEPGAMLGLSLLAPCHKDQRVVLRHAGLAVTGKTNAIGSLFVSVPALDKAGAVDVLFADGSSLSAEMAVPELAALHRFGVQWQGVDQFALHGLQDGADFASTGDIAANNPGEVGSADAYLVQLGDASVDNPLLAEVYTDAILATTTAEIAIEAPVNAATCGHDMLGQTITSAEGSATLTDLTLSMPDCGTEVGYLVLKNPAPETKIAASN